MVVFDMVYQYPNRYYTFQGIIKNCDRLISDHIAISNTVYCPSLSERNDSLAEIIETKNGSINILRKICKDYNIPFVY